MKKVKTIVMVNKKPTYASNKLKDTRKLLNNSELDINSFDEFISLKTKEFKKKDIVLPYPSFLNLEQYKKLDEICTKHNKILFDNFENMSNVYSMEKIYPLLKKIGISTPKTCLIQLKELESIAKNGDLMTFTLLLEDILKKELPSKNLVPSKNKKVFVRTFYGSNKSYLRNNFAESISGIISNAYQLIRRTGRDVGGLAIREDINLEPAYIRRKEKFNEIKRREYRFFVIGGVPIAWFYYNELQDNNKQIIEKCLPTPNELNKMKSMLETITEKTKSHFYTVDFGICKNKEIQVLELNPGYASGSISEIIPAVQIALMSYLNKVYENPNILNKIPDRTFRKQIDFKKWNNIKDKLSDLKLYWEILADWVK